MVLAVLVGVFVLSPKCASACSCAIESNPKERAKEAMSDSEAVFSGEVAEVEEGPTIRMWGLSGVRTSRVTLRTSEVWKGPQRETPEVSTLRDSMSCGYPFKEGQEYLVYAYSGKRGLEVDLCNGTRRFAEAQADLEVLGAGKKPTGGEVLSDTSGGVSAGAMVGVAGLAMVAALVVVVRLVRTG